MFKKLVYGTFFVSAMTITACRESGKPGVPGNDKDHFSLKNETQRNLDKVGCRATDTEIVCDEIADLHEIQDMSWKKRDLQQKKRALLKRIGIMSALTLELEEAQKQKWSSETQVTLNIYSATLPFLQSKLAANLAKIEADLIEENLFQTTIGYKCDGKYGKNQPNLTFEKSMLLGKNGEETKTEIINNEQGIASDIEVSYLLKGKNFRLRAGDTAVSSERLAEINVLSIGMNGEFDVKSTRSSHKVQAQCRRMTALDTNPQKMTQRITERARLKCTNYGIVPKSNKKGIDVYSLGEITANYGIEEKSDGLFAELFSDVEDTFDPQKKLGLKYFMDISMEKGEILFTLKNRDTDKVVATVKTHNSSDNIEIKFLNNGYGAAMDCVVSN